MERERIRKIIAENPSDDMKKRLDSKAEAVKILRKSNGFILIAVDKDNTKAYSQITCSNDMMNLMQGLDRIKKSIMEGVLERMLKTIKGDDGDGSTKG